MSEDVALIIASFNIALLSGGALLIGAKASEMRLPPVRTAIAFSLLVPLPGIAGLNALQAGVLGLTGFVAKLV